MAKRGSQRRPSVAKCYECGEELWLVHWTERDAYPSGRVSEVRRAYVHKSNGCIDSRDEQTGRIHYANAGI